MDVIPLLSMAWPREGKQFDVFEKTCSAFALSYQPQSRVTLSALINFGDREDTPSVMLSERAAEVLTDLLCHRCRADTRDAIYVRLRRPLSLVPRFWWADRIVFSDRFFVKYVGGQDAGAELKEIRKDILRN